MLENVDLPRLEAMMADWRETPPLHIMVAAYMGAGRSSKQNAITMQSEGTEFEKQGESHEALLMMGFPLDTMQLPPGDLTIGSGKKKE